MLGFNGGRLGSKNVIEENGDDVSLLLDGTFVDRSIYAGTVTSTGVVLDTSTTKFGSSSYQLSSGDQLSVPDQGQFALGANDFTIEGWLYRTTSNSSFRPIFQKRLGSYGNTKYIYFALFSNDRYHIWISSNGSTWDIANNLGTGVSFPANTWTHFAVCRKGSSIRIFNAGSLITTITTSSGISNDTTAPFQVGTDGNYAFFDGGRIEGFRVTNGVARYTANFTPPTAAFNVGFKASGVWTIPEVSRLRRTLVWPGTNPIVTSGLILNLDAGDANSYPGSGTTWTDLSGNGNNGTLTNGPTFDSSNGGAIVFDGSNDYVNVSGSTTVSAATFLAWVRLDDLSQTSNTGIIFSRSTNTSGMNFYTTTENVGYHWNNASNTWGWNSGVTVPNQEWCMIAITVTSSVATAYLFGSSGTNSATNTVSHGSTTLNAIKVGADVSTNRYFDGRISVAMVYNKALTASELTQNFNALKGRYGL